jgi:polar amino acid transport system substrate-binding protein
MSNSRNKIRGAVLSAIFCIYIILVSKPAFSQNNLSSKVIENQRLNIGLIVFPPYIQQDEKGNCFGPTIETIRSVLPAESYLLNIYCTTPARIYRDFENGKIDITINIKSTEGLSKDVYFSDKPARTLEIMLYSRKDREISTVSAIRQFNYDGVRQELENSGYKIIDQANSKEAVVTFLRGGTDALVSYKMPFDYYKNQLFKDASNFGFDAQYTEHQMLSVTTHFVVNKKNLQAEALIEQINNNL